MKLTGVGLPDRQAHRRPALDERLIGESLVLQPVFDRLSRLLGQLAGVALLASAGAEPDRQDCHLAVIKEQLEAAEVAFARLARPRHLAGTFHAMGGTLALIEQVMARLDRRPGLAHLDDSSFSALTQMLAAARRLLLSASARGLAVVDFSGACCAHGH